MSSSVWSSFYPWTSFYFLFHLLISWDSLLQVVTCVSISPQINECISACPSLVDQVCGINGKTYLNVCHLKCWSLEKAISGPCTKCLTQKAEKEKEKASQDEEDVFILKCDPGTGNYMVSQCHGQTGYCWCVNADNGKPIPGSSVRGKAPNCDRMIRKATKKRRPRRGERKKCSDSERNAFTENLVNVFVTEHNRVKKWNNDSGLLNQSKVKIEAIRWKFTILDQNKDGSISRPEIREFRRLMVKIIKPRSCARLFVRTCDRDSNKLLSKAEWSICLGATNMLPNLREQSVHSNNLGGALSRSGNGPPGKRPSPIDVALMLTSAGSTGGGIPLLQSSSESNQDTSNEEEDDKQSEEKGIQLSENCFQSYKNAIENSIKNSTSVLFIPECNPANNYLYNEIQCHNATRYCWCVNVDNGHPIAGTSSYLQKPNCKQIRKPIPFKGCSFKRKQKLLSELTSRFEAEMVKLGEPRSGKGIAIVKWKFSNLDLDKSRRLERSEWKIFKRTGFDTSVKGKNLRKCWRNFIRFCDFDLNNIIDESEWISCFGERDENSELGGGRRRDGPLIKTRRGPNPFSTILKAD